MVRLVVIVSVFFLTAPLGAWAQTVVLSGTVTTPDHDPVMGASVVLTPVSRSARTSTDTSGTFRFVDVSPGTYQLTVTAPGYEPLRASEIHVGGSGAAISVVLRPFTASALSVIASVTSRSLPTVSSASAPTRTIGRSALEKTTTGKLSDALATEPALTPIRPGGAGSGAPFWAALRGPDPTETLVALDGYPLNSGASGTFDLGLMDPALLDGVELIYGIAPSSLIGPDTIAGALNIRTLEPTQTQHGFARLSYGSFNNTSTAIRTTGMASRVGYALVLDTYSTNGDVHANGTGNAQAAQNSLLKLRTPTAGGRGFVQFTALNQTTDKDISALLSSLDARGRFTSVAGSRAATHDSFYDVDVRLPIGRIAADAAANATLTFRHGIERNSESVDGPASLFSEAFFNYHEVAVDDVLQYDRMLAKGMFTAQYSIRSDHLTSPLTSGELGDASVTRRRALDDDVPETAVAFQMHETDRSLALRYLYDSTAHLHYSGAMYVGNYSSFGKSVDPRFGFTWTPTQRTAMAFSAGTTFQAPQLTELFVPSPLPPVDANGPDGIVTIGNPNLTADRATEYGLNVEQIFGEAQHPIRFYAAFYQNNLRNVIEQYVPAQRPAYSYPINVGNVVYRGLEVQVDAALGHSYHASAQYVVDSAFPKRVPGQIQDSSLVVGQQFEGMPLHRASLALERSNTGHGVSFKAGLLYTGSNNQLHRPPFVVIDASATQSLKPFDVTLSVANLTNVYADQFTLTAQGVPYPGNNGAISTDAYSLPARTLTLTFSKHL